MFIDPNTLSADLDRLEEIEKASLRLVTQCIVDFRVDAAEIYQREKDLQADIGEDITREALDRIGVSRIEKRLFGKIDYKRARYVFHPEYAIRQALFIDSKAEKGADGVARVQVAQTSLRIRQIRAGENVDVQGMLPTVLDGLLTTTIFVKYHYGPPAGNAAAAAGDAAADADPQVGDRAGTVLKHITIAALPNGFLQNRYNPTADDGIWNAGPDAPTLGEKFRTRLSFAKLRAKASWRVQVVPMHPDPFAWNG